MIEYYYRIKDKIGIILYCRKFESHLVLLHIIKRQVCTGFIREGVHIIYCIEIRLKLGIHCNLLLHTRSLHFFFCKGVVILSKISRLCDATKALSVGLSDERRELLVLKICGDDANSKITWFKYTPRSSMWHPGNYITETRTGENAVHLGRKVGDSGKWSERNKRIVVSNLREISVIEERGSQLKF